MRLKIIAGNVAVMLLVGLGAFFYLKGQVDDGFGARFDADVTQTASLFARSWRLSAVEFVQQVEEQAGSDRVRAAVQAIDQNSRRRASHDRANSVAAWFQDPARGHTGRPDIVLMTDETGRVIARDQDLNRMGGQSLMQTIPTLRNVLNGTPTHDGWFRESENKLLRVAMAPIRNEGGGVIGALLVGYDISDGIAQKEAEIVGLDVAFLRENRIYSSSLASNEASAAESALGEGGTVRFEADGEAYFGVTDALPATPSQAAKFLVLGNRTEFMEPAQSLQVLLVLVAIGVFLLAAYGFLIATSLVTSFVAGLPIWALTGSQREATNFSTGLFGDIATALTGVELDITGEENLWVNRPCIFVFNHQSKADVMIMAKLVRK
ncbi:MAG: hypothetical protein AAF411_25890, partial [Myxococcota bacterium]